MLVDTVSKVREQVRAMTTPVTVPLLEATEREQLLYQLQWEYHDWMLQNETRLSQGTYTSMCWS